jgi:redox-sensitive bicupin YhaK (pirin superfamily)
MKCIFHSADSRGHADHGWLNAKHSFSFASWYNPDRIHFGALRVLNDDLVAAGKGFGMHPHDNMEIITIPLSGSIAHKDSMGNSATIQSGEVQVMSAGTGVLHSEFNPSSSDALSLFQLWIFPNEQAVEPRYDQVGYLELLKPNECTLLVGPRTSGAPVWIHQQAYISRARLESNHQLNYQVKSPGNGVYIMSIEGKISIDKYELNNRDAIGVSDTNAINILSQTASDLLVIEVPMQF